jgi:RNA polymerase sigma-70 factor (ECF subfamily)
MGSNLEARRAPGGGLSEAIDTANYELAIEILLTEYGDYIYGYCRRLLGNATEAEDVSQTVFTQAFQGLKNLSDVRLVQGWLRGIARHRCMDRLRARQRDFQVVPDDHLSLLADDQLAGPSDADPRIARALDDCMDRLDARSRQVLMLRFHDGLSFEEISDLTADTPGALRVRMSRALPALRRCLEGKGVRP